MSEIVARAAPLAGFEGGLLIGLAGAVVLLALGTIAGVSGLAWRACATPLAGRATPLAFIVGLPLGAYLVSRFIGPVAWGLTASTGELVVAGLLVGFGTRMGSGCTSGHGVCGLSRFSLRSLVNVLAFMGAGFVTVWVLRHLV